MGVVLPAGQGDRDAPVQVAGDGAGLQVAHELEGVLADVRPPVVVALDPLPQPVAERRQVEEEMLGLAKVDRRIAAALVRVDEVDRVELVAAVVALVAARLEVTADRALALDVAIGQRAPGRRVEGSHLRLLDEVPLLVQLEEEVLRHLVVVRGRGAREDVVGHPEAPEVLDDQRVVAVGELARRDALLVCFIGDRGAVLVGAARHEHPRATQPLEARQHVPGHREARDMADVPRPVGIWPRGRDENGALRLSSGH